MLPEKFLVRMQEMLGEEYEAFLASYDNEEYKALRVNTLKGPAPELLEEKRFDLTPVPWAKNGYYYNLSRDIEDMTCEDTVCRQPGKHPYHDAGVYYIQEPSAMLPGALLEAAPGEKILDLCAAPGGKSTQIAAAMAGEGVLICNEIHPARAKILSENVERMGICNAMVTNESPQKLSEIFPDYFDRIMVDAPCSGEGMFRKNDEACDQWSEENVQLCADRQDEILNCAAKMLRPGGRMVYSTCTFAPLEDEGSIERFLAAHKDFTLVEDHRLWPHKVKGEGHYAAVLLKEGSDAQYYESSSRFGTERGIGADSRTIAKECGDYLEFEKLYLKESLQKKLRGTYLKFGDNLYLCPEKMPSVKGLKVLRPGLHLGTIKKNRFEPSHALALYLKKEEVRYFCDLPVSLAEVSGAGAVDGGNANTGSHGAGLSNAGQQTIDAAAYVNGMTFPAEGEKGWYLITVNGYSLGWGKLAGGIMKNHYPKGLRK